MDFDSTGWFTPNTYSNNYADLPNGSGVYLIVKATVRPRFFQTVLYVGMSTNVARRLTNHEVKRLCEKREEQTKRDIYIKVYFKRVPKEQLRTAERRLIKKFNPPYNLQHRSRGL